MYKYMSSCDIITSVYGDRAELEKWIWGVTTPQTRPVSPLEGDTEWIPHISTQVNNSNIVWRNIDIYEKQDDLLYEQVVSAGKSYNNAANEYRIANYGKCEYAFLLHIVRNYDNLADLTVFTKCNLSKECIPIFMLLNNCHLYDYCEAGGMLRNQFFDKRRPVTHADRAKMDGIEEMYGNKHRYAETISDWIDQIIGDGEIRPPYHSQSFVWGPCICVRREVIHRYPRWVYKFLCDKFLPTSGSWNRELGNEYYPNLADQIRDTGAHYHDNLLRFWKVFFTCPAQTAINNDTSDLRIGSFSA